MTNRIMSAEDEAAMRAEAEKVFRKADFNSNGTLSHTELKIEIREIPGLRERLQAGSWKDFFAKIDTDGTVVDGVRA
jgi:hypothetical protein